jgi:hypothetical protein
MSYQHTEKYMAVSLGMQVYYHTNDTLKLYLNNVCQQNLLKKIADNKNATIISPSSPN